MKKKSRLKHPFVRRFHYLMQAVLVYFFIGVFWALPLPVASGLGGWIGRTVGPRLSISRRAHKHVHYIFPEKSDVEKAQIVRDMWDNMGRVAAEAPHVKELGRAKHIQIENADFLKKALAEKRPIMMVSGHFANWEIASMVMLILGTPMAGVYRRPNNPYVDYLVKKLRRPIAPALFTKGPDGARGMMRWLREGRAVGLLVDQKMNEGIALDFLGKPAMTGIVPAQMALLTDAIIIPAQIIRLKGCYFKAVMHEPLTIDKTLSRDQQIAAITQKINDFLSDHIRQYPGQWLWLHRRWIESKTV